MADFAAMIVKQITGRSPEEIYERSTPVDQHDEPGLYYLLRQKRIVYIGSSQKVRGRVEHHVSSKKKDFDSYFIAPMPFPEVDLLTLEATEILRHMPELNRTLPVSLEYINSHFLRVQYGIGKQDLNRLERQEGLFVARFKDGAWYRRIDIARIFSLPEIIPPPYMEPAEAGQA